MNAHIKAEWDYSEKRFPTAVTDRKKYVGWAVSDIKIKDSSACDGDRHYRIVHFRAVYRVYGKINMKRNYNRKEEILLWKMKARNILINFLN